MAENRLAEGAAAATPATGYVTLYAKTDGLFYSKDDAGTETLVSGTPTHAMLSATHSDSAASAVTRGSIIVANVTPAWAELNIGAANRVLGSDGTDAAWVQADHGAALTGLGDDDHTQYALLAGRATGQIITGGTGASEDLTLRSTTNATKGDIFLADQGGNVTIGGGTAASEVRFLEPSASGANYTAVKVQAQAGDITYTLPAANATNGVLLNDGSGGLTWDTNIADLIDHGTTTGLADDDHAQYPLLVGRSSGQVLTGGTGASEDLTLRPTTNATKGDVILVDQGGNVTIGGGATASELRIYEASGSGTNYTAFKAQAQTGDLTYTFPAADGSNTHVLTTNGSGTLSWAAAASGAAPFMMWTAQGNQPPASAYATADTRNSHSVLDFDGSTDEEAVFGGVLSNDYAGGGLTCDTWWAFTSATSGSLRVQAGIERIDASSLDIDADSFASFNSAGGTAPGTNGQVIVVTVTFTSGAQMDSLAAGEAFRLKIRRDADGTSGTDDITTDAELLRVTLRET